DVELANGEVVNAPFVSESTALHLGMLSDLRDHDQMFWQMGAEIERLRNKVADDAASHDAEISDLRKRIDDLEVALAA
ncbi:MAG: hypothetical protein R3320_11055, partial [Nitriliruptorales bacterium]|nr:hypothetical protein [Nitriliruptorales bacterium]